MMVDFSLKFAYCTWLVLEMLCILKDTASVSLYCVTLVFQFYNFSIYLHDFFWLMVFVLWCIVPRKKDVWFQISLQ